MRAIDFRLRPPTQEFSAYHKKEGTVYYNRRIGCDTAPSFLEDSMDLLLMEMDSSTIELGIAIGRNVPTAYIPNDHIHSLQSHHPKRFLGFAGIDPTNVVHDALEEIDRCILNLGLKGVAVDPGLAYGVGAETGLYPDDRRLYPIYEKCESMGVPVEIMSGPYCGRDLSYTDPTRFDSVAADFPDLRIIVGHGCWPYATEIVASALRRPNLYVSPDIYILTPGAAPYVQAANSYLAEQLLFATAYPARPLVSTMKEFLELPIRDDAKEKILYDNAARLLGLTATS